MGKDAPGANNGGAWSLPSDGSPVQRTYLAFDLPAAPAGQVLTKVQLRVNSEGTVDGGSTSRHQVSLTGAGWTETGLTWRNQPGAVRTLGEVYAPEAGRQWLTGLDATALAGRTGRTSLMLSTRGGDALRICSREHENVDVRPALVLTYGPDTGSSVSAKPGKGIGRAARTGKLGRGWFAQAERRAALHGVRLDRRARHAG